MIDPLLRDFTKALLPEAPTPVQRRMGTIDDIDLGPPATVTVVIGGLAIPGVSCLNSYSPEVGDQVVVDFNGSDPLVIGSLGAWRTALGYAEVTANQNTIGNAATDLTGLVVTVDVPATGRVLKITGRGGVNNDATAGAALGQIMEGATVLGRWFRNDMPALDVKHGQMSAVIVNPSVGPHTYKLTLHKNAGAGTVNFQAAVGNAGFILVEDIT